MGRGSRLAGRSFARHIENRHQNCPFHSVVSGSSVARKTASPPSPVQALAGDLLTALTERRAAGMPALLTLRELGRTVRSDGRDEDLLAALHVAPLKGKALLAFDNDPAAFVALKEDKERLAGDERLLRELLARRCTAGDPAIEPAALAPLIAKPLQPAFKKIWLGRIKTGALPDFVRIVKLPAATGKATKSAFHDVRFPLPWETVSRRLVEALAGWTNGLPTLDQLVAALTPPAAPSHIMLATRTPPYVDEVSPIYPKIPSSPLFLHSAADRVFEQPDVIRRAVEGALTSAARAAPLAKVPPAGLFDARLKKAFPAALRTLIERGQLPRGVGALRIRDWHLFLLEDVVGLADRQATASTIAPRPSAEIRPQDDAPPATPIGASSHATASADADPLDVDRFEADFRAAFARLDAQGGHRNFLLLHDLRAALPQYGRTAFDRGLNGLRRRRRYTLEAAEGIHSPLSDAEKAAGIVEAGLLLVYCRMLR